MLLSRSLICLSLLLALRVEASDSIPLSTTTWTSIGPAPTTDGGTGYSEATSGRVTAIATDPSDPNTFYAGAAGGGVWKTTDGGQSWTPLTDNQSSLFIGAIGIAPSNPNVLYAGTGEANNGPAKEAREHRYNIYSGRGILKSTDGGATWTLLGATLFNRRAFSRIVVSPTDENLVFAAVGARASDGLPGNNGVWRSKDGGATWTNVTSRISTTAAVSDLLIDPTNPTTLYAAIGEPLGNSANGVYRSTDGGDTWSALSLGGTQSRYGRIAMAIAPSGPKTILAAIAQASATSGSLAYLVKSTNGGTTWRRLSLSVNDKFCTEFGVTSNILAISGDYHIAIAIDPSNPNNAFLAGLCIINSRDGGDTWALLADGQSDGPHRDHHALAFTAAGHLLNGNDGGIWRLDDLDNQLWSNLNTNIAITQFQGLAADPTSPNRLLGGTQDNGTVLFNDSPQWQRTLRGDGGVTIIDPTRPARVYQVLEEDTELFARSLTGGATFTLKRAVVPDADTENRLWYFPMTADAANGQRILLGTYRLWYSTDAGVTWAAITAPNQRGWQSSDPISAIAFSTSDPKTVYAAAGGHIFATSDITAANPTWTRRDLSDTQPISAIVVDPQNKASVCVARGAFAAGQVFCTTNSGQTWQDMSGNLPAEPILSLAIDFTTAPATLYAGTLAGVYATIDTAQWAPFATGLPNTAVPILVLQGDTLSAATHGRGVWQILVR